MVALACRSLSTVPRHQQIVDHLKLCLRGRHHAQRAQHVGAVLDRHPPVGQKGGGGEGGGRLPLGGAKGRGSSGRCMSG